MSVEHPNKEPDFFISRAAAQSDFAIWLGKLLEAKGKSYRLQDKHFGPQDFLYAMHESMKHSARTIALYSPDYMASDACIKEANTALTNDTNNKNMKLIPFLVVPTTPEGMLANIAYKNLVPDINAGNADALIINILSAVGLDTQGYQNLPRPPETLLVKPPTRIHPKIKAVDNFTGREDDFDKLVAVLKRGETAITATGMGGIGKSTFAKEFGWRQRENYTGVWWIESETRETLLDGLIDLGQFFISGLIEITDKVAAAQKALQALEQRDSEKPWLLIYDNVEHPDHLNGLVPRLGAHILLTSRWEEWPNPYPLGLFTRTESVEHLLNRARRQDADKHPTARQEAEQLAELLGDLPLAIEQAGSYCRGAHMSFADYIKYYQKLLGKKSKAAGAYPDSVWTTFNLALDKVIETTPEAEKLMGLIAFWAPDDIPLDLISEEVMSPIEKGEAVAALSEKSLITRTTLDDGRPAISLHRLVQEVMRARLDEAGVKNDAIAEATTLLAHAYPAGDTPPDDVRNWPTCIRLTPHAEALFPFAPRDGEAAAKTSLLLNQVGLYHKSRADYAAAEPLFRRALEIDEKSFGLDHPTVAIRLNNLANLLRNTNRPKEAEPLYRRALEIGEKSFGPDHPRVAIRLNNLAQLLKATNRLEKAEPLMRRAIEIWETSLGLDHPQVAAGLNNLAGLLQDTNRLEEAEPLYRRALEIDEKSYGPDHPDVAYDLNNLAFLLDASERSEEALPMAERALVIFETSLPAGHPNIETVRGVVASIKRKLSGEPEMDPAPLSVALNDMLKEAGIDPDKVKDGEIDVDEVLSLLQQKQDGEAETTKPEAPQPPEIPAQTPDPEETENNPTPPKKRGWWNWIINRNK